METHRQMTVEADIQPTPRNKGVQLTITVQAYDNGLICVDGRPINEIGPAAGKLEEGHGWLGAAEQCLFKIRELRRAAAQR